MSPDVPVGAPKVQSCSTPNLGFKSPKTLHFPNTLKKTNIFPDINPVWHLLQRLLWLLCLLLGAVLRFLRFFLGFLWAWLRTRRWTRRRRCRWCNSFADLRFWPRQIQGQQYHDPHCPVPKKHICVYKNMCAELRINIYIYIPWSPTTFVFECLSKEPGSCIYALPFWWEGRTFW